MVWKEKLEGIRFFLDQIGGLRSTNPMTSVPGYPGIKYLATCPHCSDDRPTIRGFIDISSFWQFADFSFDLSD